jgi:hypothetical protein
MNNDVYVYEKWLIPFHLKISKSNPRAFAHPEEEFIGK